MADNNFCFVQDTTRPFFAIQLLKEKDHSVVSLVGATAAFYFRKVELPGGPAKVSGQSMNITDATNGKLEYRWQTGNLSDPGLYNAEVRVTFADATIQSVIIEDVLVQERLL